MNASARRVRQGVGQHGTALQAHAELAAASHLPPTPRSLERVVRGKRALDNIPSRP